jgi:hypothetical protein
MRKVIGFCIGKERGEIFEGFEVNGMGLLEL